MEAWCWKQSWKRSKWILEMMSQATSVAGKHKHPDWRYSPASTVLGQDKPNPSNNWTLLQPTVVMNWVWQAVARMLRSSVFWQAIGVRARVWAARRCQSPPYDLCRWKSRIFPSAHMKVQLGWSILGFHTSLSSNYPSVQSPSHCRVDQVLFRPCRVHSRTGN